MSTIYEVGKTTEVTVCTKGDFSVTRMTTGYAYPRNGNTHNPTPSYIWTAYRGGERIGIAYTLRGAKEYQSED
jgi:hypothetical protein